MKTILQRLLCWLLDVEFSEEIIETGGELRAVTVLKRRERAFGG